MDEKMDEKTRKALDGVLLKIEEAALDLDEMLTTDPFNKKLSKMKRAQYFQDNCVRHWRKNKGALVQRKELQLLGPGIAGSSVRLSHALQQVLDNESGGDEAREALIGKCGEVLYNLAILLHLSDATIPDCMNVDENRRR